jgi:hypothetical protein
MLTTSMQGPSTCELGQRRTRHHWQRPPPARRPTLLGGQPGRQRPGVHRRPRRLRVQRLRQAPPSERRRGPSTAGVLAALHLAGQASAQRESVLLAGTDLERRPGGVPAARPVCVPQPRRHALELAGAESVSVGRPEWARWEGCRRCSGRILWRGRRIRSRWGQRYCGRCCVGRRRAWSDPGSSNWWRCTWLRGWRRPRRSGVRSFPDTRRAGQPVA